MRSTLFSFFSAAVLMAGFSSCQQTTVSLDHLPNPARVMRGPSAFAVGAFVDQRGVDPSLIGVIGVPGISSLVNAPMEKMMLDVTVSESVQKAFVRGLDARKMSAMGSQPRLVLAGEVLDLRCEFIKNPFAKVVLRVNLVDAGSGRVLHSKVHTAKRQSLFYVEYSGDPMPVMRDLTSRALQDAVDMGIDDPEMRTVMRQHLN